MEKPVSALTFDRTVDRKLVHKHAIDEVFITGVETTGDITRLSAVLPRAHSLYNEHPAHDRIPDLCLVTEVCRQACFVVAHTRFDVPLVGNRYQFLLQEIDSVFVAIEELPPGRPVELVLECDIGSMSRRGRDLSALVWRFRVTDASGKVHVADVKMRMTWIDRDDWRRMRAAMRKDHEVSAEAAAGVFGLGPVAPSSVGRRTPDNVVLSEVVSKDGISEAIALVDLRHPVLFDHPIDHVYAMVQLEACRQLALFTAAAAHGMTADDIELAGVCATFTSVAEFDMPLLLRGSLETSVSTGLLTHYITLHQGKRRTSEFELQTRIRRNYRVVQ